MGMNYEKDYALVFFFLLLRCENLENNIEIPIRCEEESKTKMTKAKNLNGIVLIGALGRPPQNYLCKLQMFHVWTLDFCLIQRIPLPNAASLFVSFPLIILFLGVLLHSLC